MWKGERDMSTYSPKLQTELKLHFFKARVPLLMFSMFICFLTYYWRFNCKRRKDKNNVHNDKSYNSIIFICTMSTSRWGDPTGVLGFGKILLLLYIGVGFNQ